MQVASLESHIRASLEYARTTGTDSAPVAELPGKLHFGTNGNAKLPSFVAHFSLASGYSCPGARECLSRRALDTGKIKDGKYNRFRCFSASQEVLYKAVFAKRWENLQTLKAARTTKRMVSTLLHYLPADNFVFRLHVAGDFFNQAYFDAWAEIAKLRPSVLFYGYTKSLPFWVKRKDTLPKNFRLTASRGGAYDHLIDAHNLREAVVVFHPDEAKALGLEIDHDDSHAMLPGPSFALLLHGSQPKASEAAAAVVRLRKEKINNGYSKRRAKPT